MAKEDKRYGPRSQEVKDAIAEGLRGRKLSQEHKDKIGAKAKGRVWSKERRDKILETKYNKRMDAIGGEESIPSIVDAFKNGDSIYSIAKTYDTSEEVIIRVLKDELGECPREIRNKQH